MNKLKKLLGLSLTLSLTLCLIFFIVLENKSLNAQIPSNINSSARINYLSFVNNRLDVDFSILKDIAAAIVVIITYIRLTNVKEERIKQLNDKIQSKEEEYQRKITEMELQFQDKYNSSKYQKKLNTDFYALVFDELGDENMTGVLNLYRNGESKKEFSSRLKQCQEAFEDSRKAIDGLLSSDKEGKKVLKYIVYNAINKKDTISNEDFKDKCRHLYSYLRGWLICSIRYNTDNLPIQWIRDDALSQNEKIETLVLTKNIILNDEQIKKYIPRQSSRQLICQYIDILLEKI